MTKIVGFTVRLVTPRQSVTAPETESLPGCRPGDDVCCPCGGAAQPGSGGGSKSINVDHLELQNIEYDTAKCVAVHRAPLACPPLLRDAASRTQTPGTPVIVTTVPRGFGSGRSRQLQCGDCGSWGALQAGASWNITARWRPSKPIRLPGSSMTNERGAVERPWCPSKAAGANPRFPVPDTRSSLPASRRSASVSPSSIVWPSLPDRRHLPVDVEP